jgi:hypothetical protein
MRAAVKVAVVAVVAVLAGTVCADQHPCYTKANTFVPQEAVLFIPGHVKPVEEAGEWWATIRFDLDESSTYLDWSFIRARRFDERDENRCVIKNVGGDGNNGLMESRGSNQYFRGSTQRVLLGPVKDGVEATPVARCRNGALDNCNVKFLDVRYTNCHNCPTGFQASTCNPELGQSTKCASCIAPEGTYCTGAKPEYAARIVSNEAVNVVGDITPGSGERTITMKAAGPETLECPEGFSCVSGQLTKCVSSTAQDGAKYCPAGTGSKTACPEGFFCPDVTRKVLCPRGTKCTVGVFKPINCTEEAGYQPEAGQTSCNASRSGSHSPTGISEEPCPAGFRCPAGKALPCDNGTFSRAGATECSPCPAGTFSDQLVLANGKFNTECKPCAIGKFQNKPGQSSCTDCPQSAVAPSAGSTICEACNAEGSEEVSKTKSTCVCKFGFSGSTCSTEDTVISEPGVGAPANPGTTTSDSGGGGIVAPLIGGAAAIAVVGIAVVLIMRRRSAPQVESRLGNRKYNPGDQEL